MLNNQSVLSQIRQKEFYMAEKKRAVTMEKLVALCKNRGFIFPGSEIYGGLANTWDFGPQIGRASCRERVSINV